MHTVFLRVVFQSNLTIDLVYSGKSTLLIMKTSLGNDCYASGVNVDKPRQKRN